MQLCMCQDLHSKSKTDLEMLGMQTAAESEKLKGVVAVLQEKLSQALNEVNLHHVPFHHVCIFVSFLGLKLSVKYVMPLLMKCCTVSEHNSQTNAK